MAHRWRPSSTFTWNRLRRSYWLGQVRPRWRCCSTRGWLGVALRDDDAAQVGAVLAGDVLPGVFAHVVAESGSCGLFGGVQEDAPAVVGHLHVAKLCPALRIDADRGAQVRQSSGCRPGPCRSTSSGSWAATAQSTLGCGLPARLTAVVDALDMNCVKQF